MYFDIIIKNRLRKQLRKCKQYKISFQKKYFKSNFWTNIVGNLPAKGVCIFGV